MEKQILTVPFSLNALDSEEEGVVSGYASAFDVETSYGQVFKKGAFSESLQNFKKIKVLFNHSWDDIVGVPLEMYEDNIGLFTCTKLLTKTQKGADMYEMLKAGALDAFSIGFYVNEYSEVVENGNTKRLITNASVIEYSLVTFPANKAAIVTQVNSEPQNLLFNTDMLINIESSLRLDQIERML